MVEKYPVRLYDGFPKESILWVLRKAKTLWYYELCSPCRSKFETSLDEIQVLEDGSVNYAYPCVLAAQR